MLPKESLYLNVVRLPSPVGEVPAKRYGRKSKATISTRRKQFHAILRVIEMVPIELKGPLGCLLVVCALFTNETLDLNIEFNSCFCFFRWECRRRLLRTPLDFFLNEVAFVAVVEAVNPIKSVVVVPSPSLDVAAASVSFAIGVSGRFCFFRREYRRRLFGSVL